MSRHRDNMDESNLLTDGNTPAVDVKGGTSGKRLQDIVICAGWVFLGVLFVAAIVILIVLLVFVGGEPPEVSTECGTVQGTVNLGIHAYSFKGIPYAVPPLDKRRWHPPEPLSQESRTCWEGTLYAKTHGNQCAQVDPFSNEPTGFEDCLYLDVFTPTIDTHANLPVLVYIHGGYLLFGNGSMPGYAPTAELAKKHQVVYVSIQYRLSAFGFLVLDILKNRTGNYGFLDQIEALKWVKNNIQGFGGDPEQVTIFGQSSGGTSVFALMVSPLAKGLFHRAWMLSGSPRFTDTTESAAKAQEHFLNKTECKTEICLYGLSATKVAMAEFESWELVDSGDIPVLGRFIKPLAVIDGTVIPAAPFDMWDNKTGEYSDVPFLIGTTAQEIDFHPAPGDAIKEWTYKDLEEYMAQHLDPFGADIANKSLSLYDMGDEFNAEYQFTTMGSDIRLNCGIGILAEKAGNALQSGVYQYIATYKPSSPINAFGDPFAGEYAMHGLDCFGFFQSIGVFMDKKPTHTDLAFGQLLTDNILSFVKTGKPSDPKWDVANNTVALISDVVETVPKYNPDQCEFWSSNNFFKYSWMN